MESLSLLWLFKSSKPALNATLFEPGKNFVNLKTFNL